MKRSTDRILTSHVGSLFRPDDIREMVVKRDAGEPHDEQALAARLREAVWEVVRDQVRHGVDIVNDGEFGKGSFTAYVRSRLGGIERRTFPPGEGPKPHNINARDELEFPEFFKAGRGIAATQPGGWSAAQLWFCTGPLTYKGQDLLRTDIEDLKEALQGVEVAEAFMPAVTPGTIEHWLWNEHYATTEEFLFAIADAMHEEYKAIVDAGFVLQLDDPDLPDGWQMYPEMTVDEYRRYAEVRVEALNHALRGLPEDRIRLHVCWGSGHGPHKNDIDLRHIVDLVLKVRAQCYSVEASNPRHEHDYRVWEDVKLPDGKLLMPGVVGHISDMIEHPELVAERLLRYARLVGRENVIAGTDCGLGHRVAHPSIVWAKFDSLAQGAHLASQQLWK